MCYLLFTVLFIVSFFAVCCCCFFVVAVVVVVVVVVVNSEIKITDIEGYCDCTQKNCLCNFVKWEIFMLNQSLDCTELPRYHFFRFFSQVGKGYF